MFAGVIFRVPVFFMGEDDADQLNEIITVLGGAKLFEYIEKYGIEVVDDGLYEKRGVPNIPFYELRDWDNADLARDEALDLLDKMLRFDPHERITADEASKHPFFSIE